MAQPVVIQAVQGQQVILAERADAQRFREKNLTPRDIDAPVVVDLSNVRIITWSAADELLRKWLLLARNEDRDSSLVAAFYSPRTVVQETIHAVLKAHGLAAYALTQSEDPSRDEPVPIGDVTRVNEETLRVLQSAFPHAVAPTFIASELGLAPTAAVARLNELVDKGLVVREGRAQGSRGRPSSLYRYPYASRSTQRHTARSRIPVAPVPR